MYLNITMQNLFVNGCSFNGPRKKWGKECKTWVGKEVANHYGATLHNFARGGRGNRRICDTTKLFFESNPQRKKDTFAIIQWSSPGRRDYPTDDGYKPIKGYSTTWRTWSTHEHPKFVSQQQGWDVDQDHSLLQLTQMLDMQNYLKINDIPYVMYFGLISQISIKYPDHHTLFNALDHTRIYNPATSHYEFCKFCNLQLSNQDEHPSAEGHKQWAEGLIKYIDDIR
tara:strand:- start:425 stop:1102 length:678 start_codon:yes stop_codon:yes gene_type:complete